MDTAQDWRPLGEVIVELGLISQEDLEDALLEQRITHKRLGTILVDKGIVSAQQLTEALVDQIGVDELLEELDQSQNGDHQDDPEDEDASAPRSFGTPFRRIRERIHIERPASRLGKPFSRIGTRATTALGQRRQDAPVAPFSPIPPPAETEAAVEPEESFETAVLELVQYEAAPEPEPEAEATEPEPEPEPVPEAEYADEVEQAPAGPHGWLAVARKALDDAEQDVGRLEKFGIARAVELEQARSQIVEHENAARLAAEAHARAEEEIARLHGLIDERDAGLTAMEGTVEELREIVGATQAELDTARDELDTRRGELETARGEIERVSAGLETVRGEAADLKSHAAQLEATLGATTAESERRNARIAELEAQVAELQENLSATDETLGIEMHAREQAQRDAKRLHEELAERDARVAKLAQQVEALEAELEVVVAEREQSQRKLRSRDRRVEKLESTLAELRDAQTAAVETAVEPAEAEQSEPEPVAVESEEPMVPTVDARPQPKAKAEPKPKPKPAEQAVQTDGFLYFVPRAGDGYELVEQPGSAPAVGDTVELDGTSFAVTRHSRSPLPFDRRICVYLRVS
jgi:septal ring factor EnvC (AmiA/AmiB activator)